jgi:hypothetical protein
LFAQIELSLPVPSCPVLGVLEVWNALSNCWIALQELLAALEVCIIACLFSPYAADCPATLGPRPPSLATQGSG